MCTNHEADTPPYTLQGLLSVAPIPPSPTTRNRSTLHLGLGFRGPDGHTRFGSRLTVVKEHLERK